VSDTPEWLKQRPQQRADLGGSPELILGDPPAGGGARVPRERMFDVRYSIPDDPRLARRARRDAAKPNVGLTYAGFRDDQPSLQEHYAQVQADADAMMSGVDEPHLGPMRGDVYLLSHFNQLGPIRPFGPGEYVDRGSGLWSSEETRTVPYGDGYAVVPGLWLVHGKPVMVDDAQAAAYAQQSGLNWPTFPDQASADAFADQREAKWQHVPIGRSDMQAPLWSRVWPPR